jgi:hypothetical protein
LTRLDLHSVEFDTVVADQVALGADIIIEIIQVVGLGSNGVVFMRF